MRHFDFILTANCLIRGDDDDDDGDSSYYLISTSSLHGVWTIGIRLNVLTLVFKLYIRPQNHGQFLFLFTEEKIES